MEQLPTLQMKLLLNAILFKKRYVLLLIKKLYLIRKDFASKNEYEKNEVLIQEMEAKTALIKTKNEIAKLENQWWNLLEYKSNKTKIIMQKIKNIIATIIFFFTKYFKKYIVFDIEQEPFTIFYKNNTESIQEAICLGSTFNDKVKDNANLEVKLISSPKPYIEPYDYQNLLNHITKTPFTVVKVRINSNCERDFFLHNKISYVTIGDDNSPLSQNVYSSVPLNMVDTYQFQDRVIDTMNFFGKKLNGFNYFTFKVAPKSTFVISAFPKKERIVGYKEYKRIIQSKKTTFGKNVVLYNKTKTKLGKFLQWIFNKILKHL